LAAYCANFGQGPDLIIILVVKHNAHIIRMMQELTVASISQLGIKITSNGSILPVHRRKARTSASQHVVSTPNIYGTSNENFTVDPSAPSPTSTLYPDLPAAQNGHPAAEATRNMVELSPMAAPVYAVVHRPRPANAVDQSKASAPTAPPRSSIDHDTTLIDNDLYE